METEEILEILQQKIHSTIVATNDEEGLPVTCVIDRMLTDGKSLYFLTARGKSLYRRLMAKPFLALTGLKGETTMTSVCTIWAERKNSAGPAQAQFPGKGRRNESFPHNGIPINND